MLVESSRPVRVSLVATVLNEYGSLPAWLNALRGQSRMPDEFIVVDGGSTDGTVEALMAARMPFPIVVIEYPGAGISGGRNLAISRSIGDIVVVTDAGTRADPDWIAELVAPFTLDDRVDIVGGFFEGAGNSFWTRTLAAATLPTQREVDPQDFLPSSRSVAFRRRWFDFGFEYPEWLDYCEDVVLDLQMQRAGASRQFAGAAVVHFEPRKGPVDYFKQYFRYARGDGKAGLFSGRHAVRYATYMGVILTASRRKRIEITFATILAFVYIRPNVRRYRELYGRAEPGAGRTFAGAVVMIGLQRLIGDIAKMAGYPVGLAWRVKKDRSWKLWKTSWTNRLPSGDLPQF